MKEDDALTLTIDEKLETAAVNQLHESLSNFNRKHAGHDQHKRLFVTMRNRCGKIIAGLMGGTYYGYLYVDILWVDEDQRRKGYGQRLLFAAEQEALQRGCRYAHLDTHGFQALSFYEKRGYEIVGELKDLPPGDSRYLLKKELCLE